MSVAPRIAEYLHREGVVFDVLHHPHTRHSRDTAQRSGVAPDKLIKALLVAGDGGFDRDAALDDAGAGDGRPCWLVLLPADRQLSLFLLSEYLQQHVELLPEEKLHACFPDCQYGAVPALGAAYNLRTIIDKSVLPLRELYLEAGDHEGLIHLSQAQFRALTRDAEYACVALHRAPQFDETELLRF